MNASNDLSQMPGWVRAMAGGAIALSLYYNITCFAEGKAVSGLPEEAPELVVDEVVIRGISKDGEGSYAIYSRQMLQFPSTTTSDLIRPKIVQRLRSGESREIVADFAKYERELKFVTMQGNVVVMEQADDQSVPIISKLDKMIIQLDEWE